MIEKVQNLTKRVEELENWKKEKEAQTSNAKNTKIITPEENNEGKIIEKSTILTREKN